MLAHFFFVPANAKPLEAGFHEKCGDSLPAGIRIRLGKDDEDARCAAVGDPGLGAVQ
jgi:hypothetical protein